MKDRCEGYCRTCVFWAQICDYEGICGAVEMSQPERVARAYVMKWLKNHWVALEEDDPDYQGGLITPPDFGCMSYQPHPEVCCSDGSCCDD